MAMPNLWSHDRSCVATRSLMESYDEPNLLEDTTEG